MQHDLARHVRRATWRWRPLPDFLIIGAQKAGTTSLYDWLIQHPAIRPAARKEVHFFDDGVNGDGIAYRRGLGWYRSHFPLARRDRNWLTGEASPFYLYHPLVPDRIQAAIPDVRMIVLLRDPVTRALSHYRHEVRRGRESLPLLEALRAEESRLSVLPSEPERFFHPSFVHLSYKSRGLYADQLTRYLRRFGSRQLLVLRSESLFADPGPTLERVLGFLGLGWDAAQGEFGVANQGDEIGPDAEEAVAYLQGWFVEPNRRLYQLLETSPLW